MVLDNVEGLAALGFVNYSECDPPKSAPVPVRDLLLIADHQSGAGMSYLDKRFWVGKG